MIASREKLKFRRKLVLYPFTSARLQKKFTSIFLLKTTQRTKHKSTRSLTIFFRRFYSNKSYLPCWTELGGLKLMRWWKLARFSLELTPARKL